MTNYIKENNIFISIYSFGYAAGFVNDNNGLKKLSIVDMVNLCHEYNLKGIEFPIDRYCKEFDQKKIRRLFDTIYKNDLGIKIDFENVSISYVKNIIPILKDYGIEYFRVKVSNFFGCNRYIHPEFNTHYNDFIHFLDNTINTLVKYNINILIENHQDIILDDYYNIWKIFPCEYVGINWDTGNSFPALEKPMDFLSKTLPYIGNIHLKDYKIYQTKKGYKLVRCPLGKGVVDFKEIFNFIKKENKKIPMTIELGAMKARHSDIYIDGFWEALSSVDKDHKDSFISFVESNYSTDSNDNTYWGEKISPEIIYQSEFEDIATSIKYLNKL